MINIGDKVIGRDGSVYVIAEMACAHDGDVNKAKCIVDAAVTAEADAIQLQFFSRKDLMTPQHEAYDLLAKLEFSPKEWKEIHDHARQSKIHVFACTYDVPSAKLAIQLGVDGIKVNSSDLSNPDLLRVVAESGIPITLGTGASTVEEIAKAVDICLKYGGDQIIIMHGMQNFPTPLTSAHVRKIRMLRSLFPFPVGYQDHTDASDPFSQVIDLLAVGSGALVIEKHITLDRSEKGTDYQAALEPREFKDFVQRIRKAEGALGPVRIVSLDEEAQQYRKFQKKSIVASQDIKQGQRVERQMIAFMRSTPGVSPVDAAKMIGKVALRDIKRFETISISDVG